MEQLLDNTSFMSDFNPLNAVEKELVQRAVVEINANIAIPKYFSLYNADMQEIKEKGWKPQGEYYDCLTKNFGKASDYVGCSQCEGVCPQHLPIINHLKEVATHFE